MRAGPAKALPWPLLGYAPHHFPYLEVIFLHGVDHAPSNGEPVALFFYLFARDIAHAMIRKIQNPP